MTRQAAAYRTGRVLLAGDAAHVHYPVGGQGLQIGVQDAVNLGWKLAQVVKGVSPDSLLDTYQAERHPVAARVLRTTMAQVALLRTDDRTDALRDAVAELLGMDEPRKRFGAEMSGLDIRYDLGAGHPLRGRRMPDLDLVTADGPRRVFTLLHEARTVLLNLGEPGDFEIAPWADRVRLIDATFGARCRADQTRWLRRLGGGRHRYRIARRADVLVRVIMTRRGARPNRTPHGGGVVSSGRSRPANSRRPSRTRMGRSRRRRRSSPLTESLWRVDRGRREIPRQARNDGLGVGAPPPTPSSFRAQPKNLSPTRAHPPEGNGRSNRAQSG
jgi:hypothetical protein